MASEKNRTLVVGDIHGGLRALRQVLERASVTAGDSLIFLGDYVDGWSQSPEVLNFLIEIGKRQPCIFIRGNHDQLLLEWLLENTENIDEGMWFKHGGEATVKAYADIRPEIRQAHIAFLENLQNFHIDGENRLFVHAGFTNMHGVAYEYFPKMLYWDRTLWETALSVDPQMTEAHPNYPKRLTLYSSVFIGHTPVTRIGETVPVRRSGVCNVDTGAAFTGPLTILDADSGQFWQSDPLPELYPEERGRNA